MKKIKIEIKTLAGTLLFKYSSTENTIKKTLIKATSEGAYLTGADLTGADLTGAYLRGADLRGAYLRGAEEERIEIGKAQIMTGLYKYLVIPFISKDGIPYVAMGCYTRTVKDWDKDFWNNPKEFLNHKSIDSLLRKEAYKYAKKWLKLNN